VLIITIPINQLFSTLMKKTGLDPQPQRELKFWKAFEKLKGSSLNAEGQRILTARGKVTCRDCYGFGHTAT